MSTPTTTGTPTVPQVEAPGVPDGTPAVPQREQVEGMREQHVPHPDAVPLLTGENSTGPNPGYAPAPAPSSDRANVKKLIKRAEAYIARASAVRRAVENASRRYQERADSTRYMAEAMGQTEVDVDAETVAAYKEVARLGYACASHINTIISGADTLMVCAQDLENSVNSSHNRLAESHRTHTVPMAQTGFLKPR